MDTLHHPDLQTMNWADYWDALADEYFDMLSGAEPHMAMTETSAQIPTPTVRHRSEAS